jgi:hypothetical protein
MVNFPASLDDFTNPANTDKLNNPSHSSQHAELNDSVEAIEAKVGTGSSTPTINKVLTGSGVGSSGWSSTLSGLTLTSPILTTPSLGDATADSLTIGGLTTSLQVIYPIGCIYTTTVATNPATVFGFGTWVAFGAGRVLVGVGTSDAVYAAAATGGESTHALSTVELAAHKHQIGMRDDGSTVGGNIQVASTGNTMAFDSAGTAGTATGGGADSLSYSAGSGTAHNNLQPYIVVFMWTRTA